MAPLLPHEMEHIRRVYDEEQRKRRRNPGASEPAERSIRVDVAQGVRARQSEGLLQVRHMLLQVLERR